MEKNKQYVCKKDGKAIIDIDEYNFDEGYCVVIMDDGETRIITDEDCVKNYQIEEI